MASPMRIRAALKDNVVEVKILIRHDMETGKRKDAVTGEKVPAHYIETLSVKCNDKVVLESVMGIAVSKDPFIGFKFKGGAVGDILSVTWLDNIGETRTDKVTIS